MVQRLYPPAKCRGTSCAILDHSIQKSDVPFFLKMYLFSCSNRVYSTRACTVRATALGIFRASVRITHMAQVLLKANVVRCM